MLPDEWCSIGLFTQVMLKKGSNSSIPNPETYFFDRLLSKNQEMCGMSIMQYRFLALARSPEHPRDFCLRIKYWKYNRNYMDNAWDGCKTIYQHGACFLVYFVFDWIGIHRNFNDNIQVMGKIMT